MVDFIESAANDTEKLSSEFSNNLIDKSFLFLKYIITSTFLSQAIVLMDIPHQFSNLMGKVSIGSKEPFNEHE
jgi:hypothetical protein